MQGGEGVEVKLVLPPQARAVAAVNSPEIARCITPLVQGEDRVPFEQHHV